MANLSHASAYFFLVELMFVLNHGTQYAYMLHTFRGSSTVRRTWSFAMMASMELISLTSFRVLQFLLLL
jgi:hypothetical protein